MYVIKSSLAFLFLIQLSVASCSNYEAGHNKKFMKSNYERVPHWPSLPANVKLGNPTGIDIDSSGDIFIFHRADREWPLVGPMPKDPIAAKTILKLDAETGQLLDSWGDNRFIMPHGLLVDDSNNIWVTDVGLHQVFKFTHEGKLLMTLGEAHVPGTDATHFNYPTAVIVAKDGSFYVSDGYGNSRVVKFSADGKYLLEWGAKGNKESQFDIPHGITMDNEGKVYVADRENKRVQVFDANGKFIQQWADKSFGNMCSITYDKVNNRFVAVDDDISFSGLQHNGSDVIIFDTTGNIITRFGRSGSYDGPKCWYHDVVVDKEGNIYVEDLLGNSLQKFRKVEK